MGRARLRHRHGRSKPRRCGTLDSSLPNESGRFRDPSAPYVQALRNWAEAMNKSELLLWIARLREDDPRLANIASIQHGAAAALATNKYVMEGPLLVQPHVPLGEASLRDSEYFRPPPPRGRCPLSGLSRTTILEHGDAGDFRMIRIRQRGKQKGIILCETASFLHWLNSLPSEARESKGGV
jgi:hypothetical protein